MGAAAKLWDAAVFGANKSADLIGLGGVQHEIVDTIEDSGERFVFIKNDPSRVFDLTQFGTVKLQEAVGVRGAVEQVFGDGLYPDLSKPAQDAKDAFDDALDLSFLKWLGVGAVVVVAGLAVAPAVVARSARKKAS